VAFERGPEAVEKIMTQQQSKSGGGGDYRRPSIFYWKDDGEKKILRFLAEDLPLVGKFANNILTNNEKIRQMEFMINPDGTNWVEHFGAMQEEYGTRAIVEPKLRTLGVGIAVLREEVPDPKSPGRTVIVDAMTTVEKDGQKFEARQYGIVKFSAYSFWNNLQGIQRRYGTLCDRDYEVVRRGARGEKTTHYEVVPIDSTEPGMDNPDKVRERYGYGKKFADDDPKRFLYCPQTLEEWAEYYSGEERARYWLEGAPTNRPSGLTVEDLPMFSGSADGGTFSSMRDDLLKEFATHPTD